MKPSRFGTEARKTMRCACTLRDVPDEMPRPVLLIPSRWDCNGCHFES